jgi:hypothetical protein
VAPVGVGHAYRAKHGVGATLDVDRETARRNDLEAIPRLLVARVAVERRGIRPAVDRSRAMPTLPTSTTEVYLLVEQPRPQLSHLSRVLVVLDAPAAPKIIAAVAHYDFRADIALLQLAYERSAFDARARKYVVNVALAAKVGMIQPDQLSESQRKRCLDARLERCTSRSAVQRTAADAWAALVRSLAPGRAMSTPPPIPTRALATPRPALPVVSAKGTRDKLSTPVTRVADGDSDRITSPVRVRPPAAPDRIDVRYRGAGSWVAARVGAIGMNGAALETTISPRLYDDVEVELGFDERSAVVHGSVIHISTVETTSIFTVKFALDDQSRERLFGLLLAAREAKLTIGMPSGFGSPQPIHRA